MNITYLNHSSFIIKTKYQGNSLTKILTDPFDNEVGVRYRSVEADIVLISHMHTDHNNVSGVKNLNAEDLKDDDILNNKHKPFIVKTPGEFEIKEIQIKGIPSFHDDADGQVRGDNIIYTISNEGLKVCFLGDLGHKLNQSQVEEIGEVDCLIAPVGGVYTINPEIATEVISQIEPGFVIPMHYKSENHSKMYSELSTLHDFVESFGEKGVKAKDSFDVVKSTSEKTELVILNPTYT